jgi:hypothetical protein
MTRISAIAISLMLMIGLTVEVHANSGSIKCLALSPGGNVLPVLMVFNPNATGNQNVTRLRVFDQTGASIADVSPSPPVPVPGRGSLPISLSGTSGGIQIIVNWQQGPDAAPAIGRLNLLGSDGTTLTSEAQSNCP